MYTDHFPRQQVPGPRSTFQGGRPPYGPGMPGPQMPPHQQYGHPAGQPQMNQEIPEALRGPRAPERPKPKWRLKVGAVTAVVAIGAVAWVGLAGPASAEAAQVQLESVSSPGAMPFTAPVGDDVQNVASPENAAGPQAGNTGGLYAQDPAAPACDTQALIAQLTADPAKAAAWGRPLNVEPNGIGAYVTSLTTVTLRADTAVTEYGFSQGAFQPYPAVLQAGTAVMVNSFGEPTVKCQNGNPLGAATSSNDTGTVVGTAWNGFTADRTIRVTPAPAPQKTLTVVKPGNNTPTPTPIKTQPGPNTPNPAPATNPQGQLALTMTRTYDGNMRLSDGRIMDKNGKVIDPEVKVDHPPNSKTFDDGSIQHPDGKRFNINGTERLPITADIPGLGKVTVDANGNVDPVGFIKSQWNYDGTVSLWFPGTNFPVNTIGRDGKVAKTVTPPPGGQVLQDGSITDPATGKILNPDGSERLDTTIDGIGTVTKDGGFTPAPQAAAKGNVNALTENEDGAQNGGVDAQALAAKGVNFKADGTVDTDQLPKDAVVDAQGNVTLSDGTVIDKDGKVQTPGTTPATGGTGGTVQQPLAPQGGVDTRVCGTGVIAEQCPTDTDVTPAQPQIDPVPADTGTAQGGGSTTGGSSSEGSSTGSSSSGSASTDGGEQTTG
ncbi:DUF6777 domain-containing protein [Actinomycetospora termitidis]|uniref:DUF6777 domain-containing protein n=1 Tax=Actinomycetospora termitidis TaxID=3053470 RepID=A0ABT7ML48_9PSEU|nr:DUF6777 domain-containing protein [Actinomycetospora sp. Odt1-22]MDL5160078.1 hypothetical protein [Actinomycetospora sp. Odt1-22]